MELQKKKKFDRTALVAAHDGVNVSYGCNFFLLVFFLPVFHALV